MYAWMNKEGKWLIVREIDGFGGRKSMGISERLPAVLHSLDPVGPVLDTPVKFYAHHKKISPFMAMQHLKGRPPEKLLAEQIARQSNINFKEKK